MSPDWCARKLRRLRGWVQPAYPLLSRPREPMLRCCSQASPAAEVSGATDFLSPGVSQTNRLAALSPSHQASHVHRCRGAPAYSCSLSPRSTASRCPKTSAGCWTPQAPPIPLAPADKRHSALHSGSAVLRDNSGPGTRGAGAQWWESLAVESAARPRLLWFGEQYHLPRFVDDK